MVPCQQGEMQVAGSFAYTAQDPWILNASIRDNILMGNAFKEAKYAAVLEACALAPDLAIMPAGVSVRLVGPSGALSHIPCPSVRACINLYVHQSDRQAPIILVSSHEP
jgi:hypothetical protein